MTLLPRLLSDCAGAMAVETALVAPVLLMLGIGSFQVSEVVSKQHAIQAAAAEAEQMAIAKKPDTQAKLDTMELILAATSGLPVADIELTFVYTCGTDPATVASATDCGLDPSWTFINIEITDTYSPTWTQLGVGSDVELGIQRKVQIA